MADPGLNVTIAELSCMTVDRLKATLKGINDRCNTRLKMNGLKADLLQRVREELLKGYPHQPQRYLLIKSIISDVKTGANSSPASSTNGQNGNYQQAAPIPPRPVQPQGLAYQQGYAGGIPQRPVLPPPRYHPAPSYQQQQAPHTGHHSAQGMWNAGASGSGSGGLNNNGSLGAQGAKIDEVPIRFRTSPFFRVEKSLSGIATLNRAAQGDRKSAQSSFALTEGQRALLVASAASSSAKQFQVRLFCTHEDHHNPSRSVNAQLPAPIDFPSSCEIKLNGFPVPFSKGIKKQAGTAPPVDLSTVDRGADKSKALSLAPGTLNKVEVVYVNTEKKYFIVVYLVEVTSVKTVVDKIKIGKVRAKEDVIKSIISMNADPDMVATALGLSLKDPLTFGRIKIPIRSTACSHIGCFDAHVFFMMNEQTPAWACPICSKTLKVEDISVDGYFADILSICPSSVDSVQVEPDGTWRSSDDKYGTAKPKTAANSTTNSGTNTPRAGVNNAAMGGLGGLGAKLLPELNGGESMDKGKGKAVNQDALTLDSDDDEDDYLGGDGGNKNGDQKPSVGNGTARRVISIGSSVTPEPTTNGNGNGGKKQSEVIDLTLDSDDDEEDDHATLAAAAYARTMEELERGRKRKRELEQAEEVKRQRAALYGY